MAADHQYFLDTETTGFLHDGGDKIVEIGILEYKDRVPTGRHFHVYVDPQRDVPEEAFEIHKLCRDDLVRLSGAKIFADIASEMVRFVENGEVIAHNAGFDVNFLNAELKFCGMKPLESYGVTITDNLKIANMKYPGQSNSLDALLKRLVGQDNYERSYHGALLDAQLLARVYLLMTVKQNKLGLDTGVEQLQFLNVVPVDAVYLPITDLDDAERDRHTKLIERIQKESKMETLSFGL